MRRGLPHSRWPFPARETPLHRCLREEDGAGTVYALFIVALSLMLGGLAIDTVNAWRARSELAVIADLAAHAGAVALAQDASQDEVRASVENIVALNGAGELLQDMPPPGGRPGAKSPVAFLTYDPEQNQVRVLSDEDTKPNAVALQVRYDEANNTALPTYFLSMIGIASWNLQRDAVAALVPPSRCAQGDAVVSRDLLMGEGKLTVDEGFCFHAQGGMEFSRQPELLKGAWLSLPDLEHCGAGCRDLLGQADARARMGELNILQPDYSRHIEAMVEAFGNPASESPERRAFFERRPISKDLSVLAEVGVLVDGVKTGSVVDLDPMQMRLVRHLPQGLVYRVSCAGQPQETFLLVGSPGPTMSGSVLLTDCPVVVSRPAGLSRALVISTWKGIAGAGLPAIEVMARGISGTCRGSRSILMAQQPVFLLPGAAGDGLGLVSATDVALFAPPADDPRAQHRGLSVFAARTAYVEGDHQFEACGVADEEGLLPPMRIIRQVMPENMETIHPSGPAASKGPRRLTPRAPLHSASQDELIAALP